MDTATSQVLSVIIVVFVFGAFAIAAQTLRRRKDPFAIRVIPAYEIVPQLAGAGIESSRPLNLALGSAGVGGGSTVVALAGAEFFYHIAREVAIGDVSPIVIVSDTSAIPLGQDTLRRAYNARGLDGRFHANNARWIPAGTRSLAYAAAITAMQHEDRFSANVFAGSFGSELALMLDGARRRRQPAIAYSDQLEGQAVAWALADEALLGEEIFIAGGYLEGQASQRAIALTSDLLRWILILAILALFVSRLGR